MENIRKVVVVTLSTLFLMFLAINIDAKEVTSNQFDSAFSSPSINYTKIIITTLLLIVFIVVALYLVKKFRYNNINGQGLIEIVHSYPISTKDKLLIVKAAQDYLLLGASNGGIQKLHILDKEYVDGLVDMKSTNTKEFATIFAGLIGKRDHA